MKTLKSNISEAYKVQVDCLKDSEPDSYDKNDMKQKVNDLVRLNEAMQEKLNHFQNKSKFLPWYLVNGLECTVQNFLMSLNTFFELHMKSKKQVEYEQNLLLKKGKTITPETLYLVTNVYGNDNFSSQVPEKKDYASVTKEVHK